MSKKRALKFSPNGEWSTVEAGQGAPLVAIDEEAVSILEMFADPNPYAALQTEPEEVIPVSEEKQVAAINEENEDSNIDDEVQNALRQENHRRTQEFLTRYQMDQDAVIKTFIAECEAQKQKIRKSGYPRKEQDDLIRRIDTQLGETTYLYNLSLRVKNAPDVFGKQISMRKFDSSRQHYEFFTQSNLLQVAPLRKLGMKALLVASVLAVAVLGGVLGFVVGSSLGLGLGLMCGAGIGLTVALAACQCLFGRKDTNNFLYGIKRYSLFKEINNSVHKVEEAARLNIAMP